MLDALKVLQYSATDLPVPMRSGDRPADLRNSAVFSIRKLSETTTISIWAPNSQFFRLSPKLQRRGTTSQAKLMAKMMTTEK